MITSLFGVLGSIIFFKLRLPAGCMLGAMVFTGIYCVFSGLASFPYVLRVMAQIMSGAVLGSTIDRSKLSGLKALFLPALMLLGGFFIINTVAALFLNATTSLGLTSCYFGTVPGGMTDMAIISEEFGGDPTVTVLIQLVRMISTLLIFPLLGPRFIKMVLKLEHDEKVYESTALYTDDSDQSSKTIVITLLVAFAAGIVGSLTPVPAGAMIFSMLGVASFKVGTTIGFVPVRFKRIAQTIAGIYIGCRVTMASVISAASIILPLIGMIIIYFTLCALLGWAMHRVFKLDLPTTFFCCAPGGVSDMALIASDMGGAGPHVAVLQTIRLFGVVLFFPQLIILMTG